MPTVGDTPESALLGNAKLLGSGMPCSLVVHWNCQMRIPYSLLVLLEMQNVKGDCTGSMQISLGN